MECAIHVSLEMEIVLSILLFFRVYQAGGLLLKSWSVLIMPVSAIEEH